MGKFFYCSDENCTKISSNINRNLVKLKENRGISNSFPIKLKTKIGDEEVEIDAGIAEFIAEMNDMGIKTVLSRSGMERDRLKNEDQETPQVCFKLPETTTMEDQYYVHCIINVLKDAKWAIITGIVKVGDDYFNAICGELPPNTPDKVITYYFRSLVKELRDSDCGVKSQKAALIIVII